MQYFMDSVEIVDCCDNNLELGDFQQAATVMLSEIIERILLKSSQMALDYPPQACLIPTVFHNFTSTSISFAGIYTGELSIHCATELADILYSKMTGLDNPLDNVERGDALAELVNFVAGDVKQLLSGSGEDIFLSVPTSVVGTQYWLTDVNHRNKAAIFCQVQGFPFYITFTLQSGRRMQAVTRDLNKKREWLELAVERGDLGLWSFELPSGRAEYSRHWAEMLGFWPEELEPDINTWLNLTHPDDQERTKMALEGHVDGHTSFFEIEHRLARKNGGWFWCSVRGKMREALGNGEGKVFYGIMLDINNLKRYEHELKQINEQLELRVAEEVEKNRVYDQRVMQQDKMASVGQLAAGVAHEINNPLGFIISNLRSMRGYLGALNQYHQAVQQFTQEKSDLLVLQHLGALCQELDLDYILSDLEPLLSESIDGAERVRVIVQDLKNFARHDDSMVNDADMNKLVRSALNMVANELKYVAKVQFNEGKLPLICCAPQKISQVITNLLINAAQSHEEFGTITVSTYLDCDCWVVLEITDTGKGIEEGVISRIFDPFFTTKDVGKGTGLGLAISNEIVNRHNGKIDVISKPGVGSTFTVRLPTLECCLLSSGCLSE